MSVSLRIGMVFKFRGLQKYYYYLRFKTERPRPLPSIFVLPPLHAPTLRTPARPLPLLEATLGENPSRVKTTQGRGDTREIGAQKR